MSNQQKILDAILSEAKADADKIIGEAKAKADAVIDAAKAKANTEKEAAMKIAGNEAEKAYAKEISGAEMKSKKMILAAKQKAIADVVSGVKNKLGSLPEEEYSKFILSMVENAGIDKDSEILLPKKDFDAIKNVLTEKGFNVLKSEKDFNGGFIVRKGNIEYNYSFESILSVEREEIEQIAAKILFS